MLSRIGQRIYSPISTTIFRQAMAIRERGGLVSQKKQFVRWMVPPKNRVP
ncbi:hypothetical protein LguiA_021815 [Lonicera macranthoides]